MAKLKASVNKKSRHQVYQASGKYQKNRKHKLEKHLKLHPEDKQAQKALTNISDKPRRSLHVASGVPVFKELTENTIVNGKSKTVVVRKIRYSRLDLELIRLVKQGSKVKHPLDESEKALKAISLADCLKVLHSHNERLYKERLEREKQKKEKGLQSKKSKSSKNSNKSGKATKPNKPNKNKS